MNVIFISDNSKEVELLESELNKRVRASQAAAPPELKNSRDGQDPVRVKQLGITPDGLLQLPDNESLSGDIVVVDSTVTGKHTEP